MKKYLSLILSVIILLALSGCTEAGKNRSETLSVSSTVCALQSTSQPAKSETAQSTASSGATAQSTAAESKTTESTTKSSTTKITTTESAAAESTAETTTVQETTRKTQKTEPEKPSSVCYLTIDCRNIEKDLSSLKKGKRIFVPKSGYILNETAVAFEAGESAFDALKRACKENVCTDNCKYCQKGGIQLEFSFTPAYKSYYVEGIHQLYEKDCGSLSGWMYCVNGKYPDVASSEYKLKNGDRITFAYTVSMGDDLTNP